jgi:hypothetical protein
MMETMTVTTFVRLIAQKRLLTLEEVRQEGEEIQVQGGETPPLAIHR